MNAADRLSTQELHAGLHTMNAVLDAIREVGSIPSGHLYAILSDRMELSTYESLVRAILRTGLVKRENNMLIWIG